MNEIQASTVCSHSGVVLVYKRSGPFQLALTNESPAPASMGEYNYIMI